MTEYCICGKTMSSVFELCPECEQEKEQEQQVDEWPEEDVCSSIA